MTCPSGQSPNARRDDLIGAWITLGDSLGWLVIVGGLLCLADTLPALILHARGSDFQTVCLSIAGLLSLPIGYSPYWLRQQPPDSGHYACLDCQFSWQMYTL